ncbi:hypothetical protein ACQFN5_11480 [Klebsiella sp. WOUb02]|uniref:hypothetical protein n=1 Tax=Klebsiella sp. WOUb02 TaxID=3161071 RepID=UPI003CE964A7
MIDNEALRAAADGGRDDIAQFAAELLAAREKIGLLERRLATPVRLPICSASPVCEIEAGYAAGVSDCRNAIRLAGYPIEGDD